MLSMDYKSGHVFESMLGHMLSYRLLLQVGQLSVSDKSTLLRHYNKAMRSHKQWSCFKGSDTGLDKETFSVYNCKYFLTHNFKHMFWMLKRTVSMRQFF